VSAALLAALALATPLAALGEISAPPYKILFPPSLSGDAAQIAAATPATVERLTREMESPPLTPATLLLVTGQASEDREEAPPDEPLPVMPPSAPDWAAGLAMPEEHMVFIREDRVGRYAQRRLESVLAHETAHLIAYEAAGQGAALMPRWFSEGAASSLAREGEWMDFFYLWLSPVASSPRPLADLTACFEDADSPVLVRAAYAGSFSFVRFVTARHSPRLIAEVLAGLREGLDFSEAYARAAGTTLELDERAWASSMRGRNRWVGLLTSSLALWTAITLLFLTAWIAKRRRGRVVMDRWGDEDEFE
jgi:hypothetical protein